MKSLISVISVLGFLFLAGAAGWFFCYAMDYGHPEEVACTVENKWVENHEGESTTLVYCGGETFTVEDLIFLGKFNSSDIYGKLQEGKSYVLKVSGMRLPLFSHYRNINEVVEAEE